MLTLALLFSFNTVIAEDVSTSTESVVTEVTSTTTGSLSEALTEQFESFDSSTEPVLSFTIPAIETIPSDAVVSEPVQDNSSVKYERIARLLENSSPDEQANIKAVEIAKLPPQARSNVSLYDIDIELQEIRKIDGGIEVFARGWKDGKQLAFGKDGTVEIERFRIFNPPIMVDDYRGTIIREFYNESTGVTTTRKLLVDPLQALKETIAHTMSIVGKDGANLVNGKRGNTTSTYYPVLDGNARVYNPTATWTYSQISAQNGTDASSTGNPITFHFSGKNVSKTHFDVNTRTFFLFDTSSLEGQNISNATLSLWFTDVVNEFTSTSKVAIVESTPATTSSLSASDYQNTSANTTRLVDADQVISSITTGQYTSFAFNSYGTSSISKTGISKFGTQFNYDVDGTEPIAPQNAREAFAHFSGSEVAGTTQDPKLVIEHEATLIAPSDLLTEGLTNPTDITDGTPEFSAIYQDPDPENIATHYQIQVSTSSSFANTYWDTGSSTLASTTSEGNRIADVSYQGPFLFADTTYYWRIKFWNSNGLEGLWSTSTATFTSSSTNILQPEFNEGKDTFYGTYYHQEGYSTSSELRIGGWGDEYFSFVEFDLSSTAPASSTASAKIYLYQVKVSNANNGKLWRVTESWEESDPTLSSNPGISDFGMSYQSIPTDDWWVVDITDLYKDWKDGTYTNYGLRIKGEYTSNNHVKVFVSSDDTEYDSTYYPKLVITSN